MLSSSLVTERQQLAYLLRNSSSGDDSKQRVAGKAKRSGRRRGVGTPQQDASPVSGAPGGDSVGSKSDRVVKKDYEKFENGTTYLGWWCKDTDRVFSENGESWLSDGFGVQRTAECDGGWTYAGLYSENDRHGFGEIRYVRHKKNSLWNEEEGGRIVGYWNSDKLNGPVWRYYPKGSKYYRGHKDSGAGHVTFAWFLQGMLLKESEFFVFDSQPKMHRIVLSYIQKLATVSDRISLQNLEQQEKIFLSLASALSTAMLRLASGFNRVAVSDVELANRLRTFSEKSKMWLSRDLSSHDTDLDNLDILEKEPLDSPTASPRSKKDPSFVPDVTMATPAKSRPAEKEAKTSAQRRKRGHGAAKSRSASASGDFETPQQKPAQSSSRSPNDRKTAKPARVKKREKREKAQSTPVPKKQAPSRREKELPATTAAPKVATPRAKRPEKLERSKRTPKSKTPRSKDVSSPPVPPKPSKRKLKSHTDTPESERTPQPNKILRRSIADSSPVRSMTQKDGTEEPPKKPRKPSRTRLFDTRDSAAAPPKVIPSEPRRKASKARGDKSAQHAAPNKKKKVADKTPRQQRAEALQRAQRLDRIASEYAAAEESAARGLSILASREAAAVRQFRSSRNSVQNANIVMGLGPESSSLAHHNLDGSSWPSARPIGTPIPLTDHCDDDMHTAQRRDQSYPTPSTLAQQHLSERDALMRKYINSRTQYLDHDSKVAEASYSAQFRHLLPRRSVPLVSPRPFTFNDACHTLATGLGFRSEDRLAAIAAQHRNESPGALRSQHAHRYLPSQVCFAWSLKLFVSLKNGIINSVFVCFDAVIFPAAIVLAVQRDCG